MSTKSGTGGWKVIAMIAMGLSAAVAIGIGPRLEQQRARARVVEEQAGPKRVRVETVRTGDADVEVTLPGTSTPKAASTLYSKATGFVHRNLVDLGDRVQEGQVLAEIDAPETGEEIRLARARLAEARANVGLHITTADRMSSLARGGAASQQEADDALAQANTAKALVETRKADLQRLRALRDYQVIVAPFDSVITRRYLDPGALVGPASAGGVPMFDVAAVDTLRIVVDVPERYAGDVAVGIEAEAYSPHDPARTVEGTVTRTSGVLTSRTRTLRVEVDIAGGDIVLPGSFVYVRFHVPRTRPVPIVPASALVVRKEGTLLAKVQDDTVTMVPVTVGRDFGKEIEILDGITAGDAVVIQPSDTLESGTMVEVLPNAS